MLFLQFSTKLAMPVIHMDMDKGCGLFVFFQFYFLRASVLAGFGTRVLLSFTSPRHGTIVISLPYVDLCGERGDNALPG